MENMIVFSISADVFSIILCVIAVMVVLFWRETLAWDGRYLKAIFICHGLCAVCNMLGLVFKGRPGLLIHGILLCTNFGEFAFHYLAGYFLTLYITLRVAPEARQLYWRRAAALFCGAELLMLSLSQPFSFYYAIDEQNFYHRAEGYPVSLFFGVLTLAINWVLVIRYRKGLRRAEKVALWTYLILPAVATVVQPFIYGIYVIILASTVAMVVMFLILLSVQAQEYYENQRLLSEARENLMLSQIQPHFLYNVLNSIYHLCRVDPPRAQMAVAKFSDYLRGNLDSLGKKAVVPFETELEHVRCYLDLEKIRYEDLLNVDVSGVQETGFLIPCMSVQPLVENAVKHGLGDKAEGGTIWISSREVDGGYEVVIRDDGVGFDPEAPATGDRKSHIGIDSVRSRLKLQSNGTLTVHSAPGQGTTSTIFIPKE